MSDLKFQPLLFGGDINVYSVARATLYTLISPPNSRG